MTSSAPSSSCGVLTREEAIGKLRGRLQKMAGQDHSICQVAAERGIFCRGFRRWHDAEFHERWRAVFGQSTHLSRPQIERLADLWQLSEQIRCGVGLACDAQTVAPGACRGWNEFSDDTLAGFCSEVLGLRIVVAEKRD